MKKIASNSDFIYFSAVMQVKHILLLFSVVLAAFDAAEVKILMTEIPDEPYMGLIYKLETSPSNPSAAKITSVVRQHEGNLTDNDVEILMFWDPATKYFPVDLFAYFPSVKTIQVMKPLQRMASPKNGDFLLAKNLETVMITNQEFHTMGSRVFEGAEELTKIYLDNNMIETIDENTFRDLPKVKQLSLQSNYLKVIPNSTFVSLFDLEQLLLGNSESVSAECSE